MSLQGPIVVIAEDIDPVLVHALESAGANPVIDAVWSKAAGVVSRTEPAGIVMPQAGDTVSTKTFEKLAHTIAAFTVFTPVLAAPLDGLRDAMPNVLPIAADASCERIVARLASAQRVRTLHATVERRSAMLAEKDPDAPAWPSHDPLDDATVLVAGRGRTYPGLGTAVGERLGLIGALGIETAARHLNARDVDGIVVGDGFGPRTLEAFLVALAEDPRFRDLPVAILPELPATFDAVRLPNLECLSGEPAAIVTAILPLVRMHAFEARLRRQLASLDAQGLLDAHTGLFTVAGFLRDLARAVQDAQAHGLSLSIARFSFPSGLDQRASLDAARLAGRLVRNVDFACRASDGSILVVFSATPLDKAHAVARRIASVLRHTMLAPADDPTGRIDASVTLAMLKSADTVETLLARVSEPTTVAAE
ncbi:MAG: GGDEF domain-containing protein [Rhodoplanes sp.]|uniref:GGDEF domain-containing protein n=1 Tax=Rhodoplanes sp. TaxID=1968906 RepID=UPI0017E3CCAF|nr:GGDEF domain-containing protein [Rhodoplanes sp.]NVO13795.1 GGDEF domain-containing protein [Rhodoplanes sp.]